MSSIPDAVSTEIFEQGKKSGSGEDSVIMPNEIRINGQPVLASDKPIVIHEIRSDYPDIVQVTLTPPPCSRGASPSARNSTDPSPTRHSARSPLLIGPLP